MTETPRLFIVDDHPGVLKSLAVLLDMEGFHVQTFVSAEEFLGAVTSPRGCLLLDIRLPGMNGVELQSRLRSEDIPLPVILMSGHADEELREEGLRRGAVAFFEKPIDLHRLVQVVRQVTEHEEGTSSPATTSG